MLATLLLIVLGVVITVLVMFWDTSSSSVEPEDNLFSNKLVIEAVHLVTPVTVDNAGWQIEVMVTNNGNADAIIDKVFINSNLVPETGIIPSGALINRTSIGTDLPSDGLSLLTGTTKKFTIWLGKDRYSAGTTIIIEVNRKDSFELKKYLILK